MSFQIKQTNRFAKQFKKYKKPQQSEIYSFIQKIQKDPSLGVSKKGDLDFVRVGKFKVNRQETLLAYNVDEAAKVITLLSVGAHENFYKKLKR